MNGNDIRLADGILMPKIGYGCYKAAGDELLAALHAAFACGYRLIDTASFYNNEDTVGQAIRQSGIPREDIFVISKIWPSEFAHPEEALDAALKRMGLDYLDACLLHWPGLDAQLRHKAFAALLQARDKGKIRMAGVSNFLQSHLEQLHLEFNTWPVINQIEVHPLFQQRDLREYCANAGIQVVSWSPLGRGHDMSEPTVTAIAGELGKTPAQIILRWQVQELLVPIPKSVHKERIEENFEIFGFELNPQQMAALDDLNLPGIAGRIGKDPLAFPPA